MIDATAYVRTTTGSLVLDLSGPGYEILTVTPAARSWRRITTTSPFVDGQQETQAVLDAGTLELVVRCLGATWAAADSAWQALLDAVEVPSWLLEVEVAGRSQTYRARAADTTSTLTTQELQYHFRTVTLSIPVQPLALGG